MEARPRLRLFSATGGLIAINVGVFLFTLWLSGSFTPSTDVLALGWKDSRSIAAGQGWRLVTCCFLHAGWLHLLLNMSVLASVGSLLEAVLGAAQTFSLYLLAGVAGAALSYQFGPYTTVGASGAVLGLVGAGLVLNRLRGADLPERARAELGRPMLLWLAATLALGLVIKRMDQFAHLGGVLTGAVLAPLLATRPVARWRGACQRLAAAAGVALLAVSVAVMVAAALQHTEKVRIAGLHLQLEVPALWLAHPVGDAVDFGSPGIPAQLRVRRFRLQRPVPPTQQQAWLLARSEGLNLVHGPQAVTLGGTTWWWLRLWPADVVETYVRFAGDEVIELQGTVTAERVHDYASVFARAAASVTAVP